MRVYKLTDQEGRTITDTHWAEGTTHTAKEPGNALCTSQVIHAYDSPIKAALFNVIHSNFSNPILWEADTPSVVANDNFKLGCKTLTTLRQIPMPQITTEQRVEVAIRCALVVYRNRTWVKWAKRWLSGADRSAANAANAANAAANAANDADAATDAATNAAYAAYDADAAAYDADAATYAAYAANAATYAAYAATAATYAANAATYADAANDHTLIDKIIMQIFPDRDRQGRRG